MNQTRTAGRSRALALAVLCSMQLMVVLDGTIVTVALPTIREELGFSQSSLAWVVNSYMIAFAGLLLLSGRLGDLIGRRKVFLIGLSIFTAASLLCGLANSQETLIAFRFLQGVGGAMSTAVILGMIVTMYTEAQEQGRAIAIYSFVASAGASIGFIAGGVITQGASWNWIFLINVPLGVAAVLLGLRQIEKDQGIGLSAGADVVGAVLVTSGLMLGVYTIVQAADHGWGSGRTFALAGASIVLLAGFVDRQATAAKPLLALRIFRFRQVTGANIIQLLMVAGMFGYQFLTALYLQQVLGYDPAETGLGFLPVAVVIAIVSLGFSTKLVTRFGGRAVLVAGLLVIVTGQVLLARVPVDGRYVVDVLPVMVLIGAGFGMAMPALTGLAMSGATPEDSGLASGLFNTTQQAGGAVGLAVLATVAADRTDSLLAKGTDAAEAAVVGYHVSFIISVAFTVVAILLSLTVLRRPAKAEQAAPVSTATADA
ncbi:MFS transporter [Micromonospora psammae]|uniref:MFS transporter n=1 Tax=Micromonospora sp. CPCC 205556 TaxID=3122398 RepID=UPI002FF124F3